MFDEVIDESSDSSESQNDYNWSEKDEEGDAEDSSSSSISGLPRTAPQRDTGIVILEDVLLSPSAECAAQAISRRSRRASNRIETMGLIRGNDNINQNRSSRISELPHLARGRNNGTRTLEDVLLYPFGGRNTQIMTRRSSRSSNHMQTITSSMSPNDNTAQHRFSRISEILHLARGRINSTRTLEDVLLHSLGGRNTQIMTRSRSSNHTQTISSSMSRNNITSQNISSSVSGLPRLARRRDTGITILEDILLHPPATHAAQFTSRRSSRASNRIESISSVRGNDHTIQNRPSRISELMRLARGRNNGTRTLEDVRLYPLGGRNTQIMTQSSRPSNHTQTISSSMSPNNNTAQHRSSRTSELLRLARGRTNGTRTLEDVLLYPLGGRDTQIMTRRSSRSSNHMQTITSSMSPNDNTAQHRSSRISEILHLAQGRINSTRTLEDVLLHSLGGRNTQIMTRSRSSNHTQTISSSMSRNNITSQNISSSVSGLPRLARRRDTGITILEDILLHPPATHAAQFTSRRSSRASNRIETISSVRGNDHTIQNRPSRISELMRLARGRNNGTRTLEDVRLYPLGGRNTQIMTQSSRPSNHTQTISSSMSPNNNTAQHRSSRTSELLRLARGRTNGTRTLEDVLLYPLGGRDTQIMTQSSNRTQTISSSMSQNNITSQNSSSSVSGLPRLTRRRGTGITILEDILIHPPTARAAQFTSRRSSRPSNRIETIDLTRGSDHTIQNRSSRISELPHLVRGRINGTRTLEDVLLYPLGGRNTQIMTRSSRPSNHTQTISSSMSPNNNTAQHRSSRTSELLRLARGRTNGTRTLEDVLLYPLGGHNTQIMTRSQRESLAISAIGFILPNEGSRNSATPPAEPDYIP